MKKNRLGTSDLYVSALGLGCMSLGTDRKKAAAILDQAVDLGVNYLDTADLYDFGLNEEIVGEAVKRRRQDVILATKVGNRWEKGKDGWSWDPSKTYIKEQVKNSLRRLQTDYIDLYQLHGGTIEDRIDETIEAFEELKTEGVIRHYGISSIRPNVIREYLQKSSIISVMMQYSILDRRPEEEIMEILAQHNISIIARGPLAKGLLTNQTIEKLEEKFSAKDYLDYSYKELCSILPKLQQLRPHHTLTETAIQYCLHSPAVGAVIPGASSIEQLKENVDAANPTTLSDEEMKQIQHLCKASRYEAHR
ncbi:aldo/keto reductase [Priestia abyssalis]|uniref:aldo/keto reductase n=1 Tax=Priestia abyssalis TaxID=1221450 RepID=UPI000994D4EF|nr:aldo/keto reductase [Priestia abyssalis]